MTLFESYIFGVALLQLLISVLGDGRETFTIIPQWVALYALSKQVCNYTISWLCCTYFVSLSSLYHFSLPGACVYLVLSYTQIAMSGAKMRTRQMLLYLAHLGSLRRDLFYFCLGSGKLGIISHYTLLTMKLETVSQTSS